MSKPMTVRDLIRGLQQIVEAYPAGADLEVDSEGCDCVEPAVDVRVYSGSMTVDSSGIRSLGRRVLVARGLT